MNTDEIRSVLEKHINVTAEQNVKSNASFALVFDEITTNVAKDVIQWLIENNFSDKPPDQMNLVICSPGGDLLAAFAIIDVMKSCTVPIRTIGLGQIASAALMIFMTGTKGERILTPNTSILSHAWSGGSVGKVHELFAIKKEFDLTNERVIKHYVKYTGLSEKKILKYLLPPQDVYLSAEEAVELGLADKIALL